jgi:2,4-dienoyl-CoA reductase-like NADH-dependent reductase (Old Yellow Enzyme family)
MTIRNGCRPRRAPFDPLRRESDLPFPHLPTTATVTAVDTAPAPLPPAPAASPFPNLFAPIRLGPAVAPNRIMRVATTANLAERNRVGKRMLAFYATVARGGAGTIVSEAVRVHPMDAVTPGAIALFDRKVVRSLRKISDAIHDAGSLFIVQLNHGGRQHLGRRVGTLLAPSAIACPRSGGMPHAMTTREVEQMVEYFLAAAVHAREADADGVEIHGAQGHLIGQFTSPYSNRRDDRYGGSLEKRLRFAREILEGARRRLGPRAVIGFRMGVEEFTAGGVTIDAACEIVDILARDGLFDYVSLSQGNFNSIETHLPDRHWPQVTYRDIHRRIKATVPQMAVVHCTRIQTPEQAEDIIASGDGDMVGLCRALLVDPEWPRKAREGRPAQIRRCIACNQCWDWIASAEPIACAVNPRAGREHLFRRFHRAAPERLVVVGGGPAGLEAARVAAERGLRVVLLERRGELGGKFADARRLATNAELRHLLDFQIPAAERAGVEIRLGVEATTESVLAERPYAAIIAAGAEACAPALPGDGSVPVLAATSAADVAGIREGGAAIVLMDEDGYFWGSSIAEEAAAVAARTGRRLVVVTRHFEAFRELPMVSRIATLRALDQAGVQIVTSSFVAGAADGGVQITHALSGRTTTVPDCAAVIWTGMQNARNALHLALKGSGFDRSFLIGDAFAPRRLPVALLEAHNAARAI